MTLTMTRGLPGSGKTTWARTQSAKRVSKDDLRAMLDNGVWSRENEILVLQCRDNLVRLALGAEQDVIVDDTGFSPKHERTLVTIARAYGAEFVVRDFTDVPLGECLRRNAERTGSARVPDNVIRDMNNKYLLPKYYGTNPPYPQPVDPVPADVKETFTGVDDSQPTPLPTCVLVDIDGTVALNTSGRSHYPGPQGEGRVGEDTPNIPVVWLVRQLLAGGNTVVFLSGRTEACRYNTWEWLKLHVTGETPFNLYMRPKGDIRPDSVVKKELYDRYVRDYYQVRFVLDDRDSVVRLWRSLGLTCLQVAEGKF